MNYRFLIFVFLAIVFCLGCAEQQQKPLMDTIMLATQDEQQDITEVVEMTQEEFYASLPLITTTDLDPGLYRMKVEFHNSISVDEGVVRISSVLTEIGGDDIYDFAVEHVFVEVMLKDKPFLFTLENKEVIPSGLGDHVGEDKYLKTPTIVVVEIQEFVKVREENGGRTGRPKTTYHRYKGNLIANLTYPDRLFEYDEEVSE